MHLAADLSVRARWRRTSVEDGSSGAGDRLLSSRIAVMTARGQRRLHNSSVLAAGWDLGLQHNSFVWQQVAGMGVESDLVLLHRSVPTAFADLNCASVCLCRGKRTPVRKAPLRACVLVIFRD